MLKKRIASLNDVDEKYRGLYTEQSDGTFLLVLDIEGMGDIDGLKQNNYDLKGEKIKLQERLDELEEQDKKRKDQNLLDDKKYDELLQSKEKAWQDKFDAQETRTNTLLESVKTSTLNSALTSLATELAGERSALLEPHLKSRLNVEEKDGAFTVSINDVNGNASAMTLEQLSEEFKANKVYAPLLKGRDSSGSGGGSDGTGDGEGAADVATYEKHYDPKGANYSAAKQTELQSKNKDLHDSLVKKYDLNNPMVHM